MLRGFGQAFGIKSMSGVNINTNTNVAPTPVGLSPGHQGTYGGSGGSSSVVFPPVKNHQTGSVQNHGMVPNPMHNTLPTASTGHTATVPTGPSAPIGPTGHGHPSTTPSQSNVNQPSASASYTSSGPYKASSPLVQKAGTGGDDSFEMHGRANVATLLETGNAIANNNNNNNNNNPLRSSPAAAPATASNVTTPQSPHQHQHTHSTGTKSFHSTLSLSSSQSQPQSQPSSHHSNANMGTQQTKSPYHEVITTTTTGNTGSNTGRKSMVGLIPGIGNGGMTSGYDDDVDRHVVSTLPTIPPTLFSSPVGQDRNRNSTPSLPKSSPNPNVVNPFQDLPPRSPKSSPTVSYVPPVGLISTGSPPSNPPSEQTQPNPEQAPELWNTPPRTMNNMHPSRTPNTNSITRRNNDEKAEWDNIMNNMWSPG